VVIARPSIITEIARTAGSVRRAAVVGDGLLAVAGVLGARSSRPLPLDHTGRARIRADPARRGPEHDRVVDGLDLR